MDYLYEMHSHVSEVSTCSPTSAKKMVEYYEGMGYTGIVITDHLNESTFKDITPPLTNSSWDEKIDHFLTGYKALKKAAEGKFKVFLGMEIRFYGNPNDFLVYGVTEEFLRAHGDLLALKPKSFSKLARENGLLFIQAHPFRKGMKVENPDNLDGYEIYNGNPRHNSSNDIAEIWAKKYGKTIVTSGSDFHEKDDEGRGGIYFNKLIETNEELIEELKKGNYKIKRTE